MSCADAGLLCGSFYQAQRPERPGNGPRNITVQVRWAGTRTVRTMRTVAGDIDWAWEAGHEGPGDAVSSGRYG